MSKMMSMNDTLCVVIRIDDMPIPRIHFSVSCRAMVRFVCVCVFYLCSSAVGYQYDLMLSPTQDQSHTKQRILFQYQIICRRFIAWHKNQLVTGRFSLLVT